MKDSDALKIIGYNRQCVEKIKKWIKKEKNIKKQKDLIEFYLHFCTNNISGIYSDSWIEKKIIEYGSEIDFHPNAKTEKDTVLIVMTVASGIGGHTALANNWIQFDKKRKYSIVLTDCSKQIVPDFLKESVKASGGNIYYLKKADNVSKAEELLDIAQSFEHIILNIHMYDMVPIISFGHKNWIKPICFYNHADFLFSVGMSVSDLVFTLNKYDNKRAIENRGAFRAEVLPFPQSEKIYSKIEKSTEQLKKEIGNKYCFDVNSKIVLTMGSDFKFIKTERYDFEMFVENVLKDAPQNTYFFLIGANPESKRWTMMKKNTNNHAQALGFLNREEVSRWMKIADAYVTSFPMTSAGSAEARINNIPNFRFSPTGRANEYLPKEEIYDSIEDLKNAVVDCLYKEKYPHYEIPECAELAKNVEKWCQNYNSLLETVKQHEIHDFNAKQIIENQEIINVQLLRKDNYPYVGTRKLGIGKYIRIKLIEYRRKRMYCKFNKNTRN